MRLYILAYDGSKIAMTGEMSPEQFSGVMRDASGKLQELTEADLDELTEAEQLIRGLVEQVVASEPNEPGAVDIVHELHAACFAYWMSNPDIRAVFDEKVQQMDGFIKVYPDHVECGWQEPDPAIKALHDFGNRLAEALVPVVGRKPKCYAVENEYQIRFPDTLYWLVLARNDTRPTIQVTLEHRLVAYRERPNAVVQVDASQEAVSIAQEIDRELFQKIRGWIREGHADYAEGSRFHEHQIWNKAYRRRTLLDIWAELDGNRKFYSWMSEYFEESSFLAAGVFAIALPLFDGMMHANAGDDLDDEDVNYCLGYITGLFEQLDNDGTFDEYGVHNWRDWFLGHNEEPETERTQEEEMEFIEDEREQLLNVLPLSVLQRDDMLAAG